MHRARFALCTGFEPAFLKYLQHRGILGQDFRRKFGKTSTAGNCDKMTQKCAADALSLVFVDHSKRDLRRTGSFNDITSTGNNYRAVPFIDYRDQGDMVDEVDVQKEVDFFFGKIAAHTKKTSIERLRPYAVNSR